MKASSLPSLRQEKCAELCQVRQDNFINIDKAKKTKKILIRECIALKSQLENKRKVNVYTKSNVLHLCP